LVYFICITHLQEYERFLILHFIDISMCSLTLSRVRFQQTLNFDWQSVLSLMI